MANPRYVISVEEDFQDALMLVIRETPMGSIRVRTVAHVKELYLNGEFIVGRNDVVDITPTEFFNMHPNCYKLSNFDFTNGKEKEMENRFIVDTKFKLSDREMETLVDESKELLDEYDHNYTEGGLRDIFETWARNKGNLIEAMKHHPNYVDGKYQIVFSHDYEREIDKNAIYQFVEWCKGRLRDKAKEKEMIINGMTRKEASDAYSRLDAVYGNMVAIRNLYDSSNYFYRYKNVSVNGQDFKYYHKEMEKFARIVNKFNSNGYEIGRITVDADTYKIYDYSRMFFDSLLRTETHIANEEFASNANYYAENIGYKNLNAVAGQKITRIVGKFCKHLELDKIKDVRLTFSGREKDYGYKYQYALFCDAISPLKIKRHTIISANPIDYWTMSFGNSWASCQTIDGKNKRGMENSYHGMYMSGTTSYMLDGTTLIMYTVDSDYNGNDFELQPKMQRCNFHIGEDKMIQGRVYPDGRDGGNGSLSEQFRNVMQKVVADMYNVPNLWFLKKGTNSCEEYEVSEGTNYKDYECYDDCTVSLLKDENGNCNRNSIVIGHSPICPVCGCEHEQEESLCCEDCKNDGYVRCAVCGDRVREEDAIYCEDNGHYYCDESCANRDDVVYCENVDEWHSSYSDEVHLSDYTGEYFYGYDYILTENGNVYMDEDEAMNDGYLVTSNGEWYPEDEFHYCEHCGRHAHESEWNEELGCCVDCEDEVREQNEEVA